MKLAPWLLGTLCVAGAAHARLPGLTHVDGQSNVGFEFAQQFSTNETTRQRFELFGEIALPVAAGRLSLFGAAPMHRVDGFDTSGDNGETVAESGLSDPELGVAYTLETPSGWQIPIALSAYLPVAGEAARAAAERTAFARPRDLALFLDGPTLRASVSPVLPGGTRLDLGVDVPTDDEQVDALVRVGAGHRWTLTERLGLDTTAVGLFSMGTDEAFGAASIGLHIALLDQLALDVGGSVPLHAVIKTLPATLNVAIDATF